MPKKRLKQSPARSSASVEITSNSSEDFREALAANPPLRRHRTGSWLRNIPDLHVQRPFPRPHLTKINYKLHGNHHTGRPFSSTARSTIRQNSLRQHHQQRSGQSKHHQTPESQLQEPNRPISRPRCAMPSHRVTKLPSSASINRRTAAKPPPKAASPDNCADGPSSFNVRASEISASEDSDSGSWESMDPVAEVLRERLDRVGRERSEAVKRLEDIEGKIVELRRRIEARAQES